MDTNKKQVNITSIPANAEITITVGGLFYQRLNKLLIDFGDSVDKKQLLNAMYKIKKGTADKDHYAFNLETLIILLRDIEQEFRKTGQAVEQDVDIDLPADWDEFKDKLSDDANDLDDLAKS